MRGAHYAQVLKHGELAAACRIVHNRLPKFVLDSQVYIELLHERLERLNIAEGADVVNKFGALGWINHVAVDREITSQCHDGDWEEGTLNYRFSNVNLCGTKVHLCAVFGYCFSFASLGA